MKRRTIKHQCSDHFGLMKIDIFLRGMLQTKKTPIQSPVLVPFILLISIVHGIKNARRKVRIAGFLSLEICLLWLINMSVVKFLSISMAYRYYKGGCNHCLFRRYRALKRLRDWLTAIGNHKDK